MIAYPLRDWGSYVCLRLGLGVIEDFNSLKAETQAKNILAWTPIVAEVLQGFCRLDDQAARRSPYH